ncbi:putative uncharacterized protein [Pseudarthrobacter siccitolerans]|uniref:Uncharacterized protein n=1 Tax=Pseudarthrobacter siccitolerans TaxID=861266 RepID=A0A024H6U5_9MICC|nr:hypothetical protein [Pseudarthrobacter siccitolerans]CCQ47733.1 putative uncharacterized protein [Pseudarthrobacter siccitolerans]
MVKTFVPDPAGLGQPISLAMAAARAWDRVVAAFKPRSPYRIGDAVVGDDPFNGRREGVVISQRKTAVGVHTAHGVFFYDHRQLRQQD